MRLAIMAVAAGLMLGGVPQLADAQSRSERDRVVLQQRQRELEEARRREAEARERRLRLEREIEHARRERRQDVDRRGDDDRSIADILRDMDRARRDRDRDGDWDDDEDWDDDDEWERERRRGRDRVNERRGRGPAFCRTGEGHPVFGRQWCRDKGFGLGVDRRDRDDRIYDRRGDVLRRAPRLPVNERRRQGIIERLEELTGRRN